MEATLDFKEYESAFESWAKTDFAQKEIVTKDGRNFSPNTILNWEGQFLYATHPVSQEIATRVEDLIANRVTGIDANELDLTGAQLGTALCLVRRTIFPMTGSEVPVG